MQKNSNEFGIKDKIGYLFGDFGCNMSFQLILSYLMLFVTQGLGISAMHWAIIVIVAKIFDAINDPIVGALVDMKKAGKNGKFRPWILWGGFAIALTTTLLFVDVRSFSYWGRFSYVLITYMVWSIAYTASNVPYGSLNAVLTDDPGERASLSSLRSIGSGLATLPLMIVLPQIIYGEKNSAGYASIKTEIFVYIALVCGLVGIIGFGLTYFLTRERKEYVKADKKFNYFKTLLNFFKNRPAMALCLASFAQLVFIMSYSITLPLVFQFYFMNTKIISVVTLIVFLPMMILIPFMGKLSLKYGKKEISTWPNLLSILVLSIMLLVNFPRNMQGAWAYAGLLGVAMFAGGTFTLATWSMVADCVDQQEINTGTREEASVYATYSLARKIAQGIGAGLVSICLSFVGYDTSNVQANTNAKIANGILKLSIILLLIGFVIIFFTMLFAYNLNKKKVQENTDFLREKHLNMQNDNVVNKDNNQNNMVEESNSILSFEQNDDLNNPVQINSDDETN